MKTSIQNLSKITVGEIGKIVLYPHLLPTRIGSPSPIPPNEAIKNFFTETSTENIEALRIEFLSSHAFFEALNQKYLPVRAKRARISDWYEFMYIFVRLATPDIFVETGVFDGVSSSVILLAMDKNQSGKLFSIDLPATASIHESTHRMPDHTIPAGMQPSWTIPESLKTRHRLEFGDSKVLLPKLLEETGQIDVFFHDSLHTHKHMLFEYTEAWPHIRDNGFLLSDDIMLNSAYHGFCNNKGLDYVRLPDCGFAAARKTV